MIPPREIANDIWPGDTDNPDKQGNSLKGLISRFNGKFGFTPEQRLIVNTTNGYGINPEYNIQTDMMLLDQYYDARLQATTKLARIEMLEKGIEIYKGKVLPEASHELWLLDTEIYYHQKYINMVNELLQLLDEQKEFQLVIQYALQSLKIAPENADAYFWMILALCRQGLTDEAHSKMKLAKQNLTEEEYQDLLVNLKKHRGLHEKIRRIIANKLKSDL